MAYAHRGEVAFAALRNDDSVSSGGRRLAPLVASGLHSLLVYLGARDVSPADREAYRGVFIIRRVTLGLAVLVIVMLVVAVVL